MPASSNRLHPAQLAFGPEATTRFAELAAHPALDAIDCADRDAWLLTEPVAQWLHQLRPESGLGEAVHEFAVLAHQGFLFWKFGCVTHNLGADDLVPIGDPTADSGLLLDPITPSYVQLPLRRIWGVTLEGSPPEPLDGWFAYTTPTGSLELAAVFGLHPGRDGFTVVAAAGRPPFPPHRADGGRLFAPTLPGADAAGLWSILSPQELLELARRTYSHLAAAPSNREP